MAVTVVRIREVRMRVRQRFVTVAVGVTSPGLHGFVVCMLVVLVVVVLMRMLERFMPVLVLVTLRQV